MENFAHGLAVGLLHHHGLAMQLVSIKQSKR